jgi:hypothetical protein
VFIPANGAGFRYIPPSPTLGGRVARHVQSLGIAWCAYGSFRLAALASGHTALHSLGELNPHIHVFLPMFGFSAVFWCGLSVLAGIGLLTRRPWARKLALVLGVLALFRFPLGTALGVYTLWALGSGMARQEWRSLQVTPGYR